MDSFAASAPTARTASSWKNPLAWLRTLRLSRSYWVFFSAAFFYDAGFSIYFFLFNLYLLDCGFNERAMGWIGGAFTAGSLIATLPAGIPVRKFGPQPLLIALFVSAPILNAARAEWIWEPAQIALAFLAGVAMSAWGVCFLPAVARLTTDENRTSGFSMIFSVSVGTSMLGGIACGYLRDWLAQAGIAMQPATVKRLILITSCAIVFMGLIPVLRLRIPAPSDDKNSSESVSGVSSFWKQLHPFLVRFLPAMALWSAVLAAFTPFANIYLVRELHVSMARIGLIFTAVQLVQLCMGLITPPLFRAMGLMNGIFATQIAAALVLALLAGMHHQTLAIALYMVFSAAQWASSPGLYNLLMNEVPDAQRGSAAAMTMFSNALAGSIATALAGSSFTRFGYPPVLWSLAIIAFGVSLLFRFLVPSSEERSPDGAPIV